MFPGLSALRAAPVIRVATYNLENYLLEPLNSRPAKSPAGRAKVRETLRALHAEVVALQEVGGARALEEIRSGLRADGLDYPFSELIHGPDTNIQLAVISRLPIVARRPHTNDAFLLFGRRFRVSRGFLELDVRAGPRQTLTLIAAHLKSRRPVPEADEAELREQEALILRQHIEARLSREPFAKLAVLGDLNDVMDSKSTRAVIGRGRYALIDTRPAERNGDTEPNPNPRFEPRRVTWTHHFGKEDTFSRVDYILISKSLVRVWVKEETCVLALPNWGVASDHRPIVAGFAWEN